MPLSLAQRAVLRSLLEDSPRRDLKWSDVLEELFRRGFNARVSHGAGGLTILSLNGETHVLQVQQHGDRTVMPINQVLAARAWLSRALEQVGSTPWQLL